MVPKKEPCSDEPHKNISEISPKVVTNIVNIFSDDDLFETDEPASALPDKAPAPEESPETLPDRSFAEIPDEFPDSPGEEGETLSPLRI